MWIDENLSFEGHIHKLKSKLNSGTYALSTSQNCVPIQIRKLIYSSLIESHLRIGSVVYGAARPALLKPLSVIQKKAVRLVASSKYNSHTDPLFKSFHFLKVNDIIQLNQSIFMQCYSNNDSPISFRNFFTNIPHSELKCRDNIHNFQLKKPKSTDLSFYPNVQLIRNWNGNETSLKSRRKFADFKKAFIDKCLNSYEEECLKNNCYICI